MRFQKQECSRWVRGSRVTYFSSSNRILMSADTMGPPPLCDRGLSRWCPYMSLTCSQNARGEDVGPQSCCAAPGWIVMFLGPGGFAIEMRFLTWDAARVVPSSAYLDLPCLKAQQLFPIFLCRSFSRVSLRSPLLREVHPLCSDLVQSFFLIKSVSLHMDLPQMRRL